MGPDKLQSLLYAFIENRHDDVDVIDGQFQMAVEADNSTPLRQYFQAQGPGLESVILESAISPLQFFPFAPVNAQSPSVVAAGRRLTDLAQQHSMAYPDKSLVKFKEVCLVLEPKEQTISVPVIRDKTCIGKETRVSWETCDKTAVSGTHFVGSSGEIVFDRNDTEKFIEIKILDFTDEADDLRFTVKIPEYDGMFIPTPLTITLKKVNKFYADESNVLNSLPRSLPIRIDDIRFAVEGCLTSRTFHMALTHLCSTNQCVDVQLALAFELTSLCYKKHITESVINVLKNYFRNDDIDLESV